MINDDWKGFDVICPYCHDSDARVRIDLNDLAECHCSTCDEIFTAETARDLAAAEAAKWQSVVDWIAYARGKNAARELLASWVKEGDAQEQRDTLAVLRDALPEKFPPTSQPGTD